MFIFYPLATSRWLKTSTCNMFPKRCFVKALMVIITAICSDDTPNISLLLNPDLPQLAPT